jgi:flagellin-like hook-associated protein FlgL
VRLHQCCSVVLDDLMYLFKDSLERLASMKQIEDSKADAAVSGRLLDLLYYISRLSVVSLVASRMSQA